MLSRVLPARIATTQRRKSAWIVLEEYTRCALSSRAVGAVRPISASVAFWGAFVVMIAAPHATGQLVHRYSFTANANDSVSGANGTVIDAGTTPNFAFAGGQLDLSANAGNLANAITEDAYVDLPNGIVSAATTGGMNGAVAFEWWYTVSENRTWQRIGDFGTSNGGEDMSPAGSASPYLSIVTTSGRGNIVDMTNHTTTGQEPVAGFAGTPAIGQQYHVMAVYNHNDPRAFTAAGANGTMTLYLNDGVTPLVAYGAIHPDINIRTLTDVNNWLGRSQWNDPLFDGMFNEFRIYNSAPSAAYVASSFAAGPDATVPFQVWTPEFNLAFEVDRNTGTFTLKNTGPSINVVGISIGSASGALDPTKWKSVSGNYDLAGNASFDTDGSWSITSTTATQLTEVEVAGNGGQLGTGGTAASLQLGLADAWTLSRFEDVVVSITRLLPDNFTTETIGVPVSYLNGIGQAAARSDLNFDGAVTAADWILFASHHLEDLSTLTVAQAATLGDLNQDLANDYEDFLLFRGDYDAANGPGALAAVMAVPEPSSLGLLVVAGCAAMRVGRRKAPSRTAVLETRHASTRRASVRRWFATVAVAALTLVNFASRADANVVSTASGALTGALTGNTFNYTLQGGGNALVVGVYSDVGGGNFASNVTFAGVPATGIVTNDRVNLMYMFDPAPTGAITFDLSAINTMSNSVPYFLYEIAGVETGGGVDTGTGGTITTTVDNRFVINFLGANNTDGTGTVPSPTSILTKGGASNGNGQFGGGATVAGHAEGRATGVAGTKDVGWTFNPGGGGAGFGGGSASIAFNAPPPMIGLSLIVNKTTNEIKIKNTSGEPISFDYYSITSSASGLNATTWNSLDDSNFQVGKSADFNHSGTVNGTDLATLKSSYGTNGGGDADGDGDTDGNDFLVWQRQVGSVPTAADGWIEAGGSSSSELVELFLDGASTLTPGQEVSLGAAYNNSVFGGADGDLFFDVSSGSSDTVFVGSVTYVAAITAVPEPASAVMVLAAVCLLRGSRRRTS
jgi:hypothetical protein